MPHTPAFNAAVLQRRAQGMKADNHNRWDALTVQS